MNQPLRVLIAEDNPQDAKLNVLELRQAGFDPDWQRVDTEAAFLSQLHANWDIILSDYEMPQFGGLRALELLNESGLDVPFIIISGTIGEEEAVEAMKLGATDYLLKDRLARLGKAVSNALEQRRLRRERKAAEVALSESEERFRGYFELGLIGMAITSPDKGYIEVNDELCRMLGYARGELLQKKWSEITHPDDLAANVAHFNRVIAGEGDCFSLEKRFVRKDGRIIDATISVKCLRHANHSINYCMLLVQDITEHKRAEAALRESEKQLKLITNNVPCLISYIDKDLRYKFVNAMYEKVLNLPREKILTMSLQGILSDEVFARIEPYARRALAGECVTFESHFKSLAGDIVHAIVTYVPDSSPDGTVKGLFTVVTDVTLLKTAQAALREREDQLRQSQKMEAIGQLAGGVAHDFNNQLSVILGYANLLSQQLSELKLCRFADNISVAARRSADLTQKLLVFARKGQARTAPVDLHALLAETVEMLERSVDKRIILSQLLKADLAVIVGNASQLQNALLNLGINARDAMPEGGTLTYRTENIVLDAAFCASQQDEIVPGQYIKVSVSDTGTGMSDEVKKHLFEPFFTTKPVGKGTGLGLASVYGTVKQHAGALMVASTLGQGTSFQIYLPLANQSAPQADIENATVQAVKGLRILVVEDEELLRTMLVYILSNGGHEVQEVEDGKAAVAFYQRNWQVIDLVFLDMVMPEMNGHDTFLAMKKINPAIKAVLCTGYSLNSEVQAILDDGVLDFMQKPFEPKQFQETIAKVMRQ